MVIESAGISIESRGLYTEGRNGSNFKKVERVPRYCTDRLWPSVADIMQISKGIHRNRELRKLWTKRFKPQERSNACAGTQST